MARKRSTTEIAELVERYNNSGLTQAAFCRQAGVGLSTLDRYLRKARNRRQLVRVQLQPARKPSGGFALVLGNGRRIESGWDYQETGLVRLIRVAEAM